MVKLWKKIPLWLKCGVITDLLLIIIVLFAFFIFPNDALPDALNALMFILALFAIFFPAIFLPPFDFIRDLFFKDSGFWGPNPTLIAVIYSLFFWFIIASVIGFIIEKIRSRKKPTI